jgi:hypothetical protein
MPRQDPFRFDFAISFSGAQRSVAQEIAEGLKSAGFTVFYDKDEVYELLGEDGEIYLRKLYSAEARFYVVLVSRQYDKSFWTNVELDAIRSRESLEHHEGVLLPVIVGSFRPKWLSRERIFFDLRESSVPALVEVLGKKVSLREDSTTDNIRSNVSDCQVFIISALGSEMPTTKEYANLIDETESTLRGLGFRVERSDLPESTGGPSIECTRKDMLVALQVKAVIDSLLCRYGPVRGEQQQGVKAVINTLLRRYGLLKRKRGREAYIRLETGEASATSPGKLTVYF